MRNTDRTTKLLLGPVLRDSAGKDRVVLSVDRGGEAGFEILDASGKVGFSSP